MPEVKRELSPRDHGDQRICVQALTRTWKAQVLVKTDGPGGDLRLVPNISPLA